MIDRRIFSQAAQRLDAVPAVVLLGPRQSGKTTLAHRLVAERGAVYLDLESAADRAKLADPESYLRSHLDRLVVLDEIHRVPSLFPLLRGSIDQARREGRRAGRYLLLGSASLDLLRQSGESLAGRVSYLELTPFDATEIEDAADARERLWLRGGFPESYLAANDGESLRWRRDFLRAYLERDIPQFRPRASAEWAGRLWTMLAHHQGGLLNVAQFARNLGVDKKTATAYIELLHDLLLVRRLPNWHANVGKRLVKAPKLYVRDSGLVHALLSVGDSDMLLSHPVVGASWEGFVIEQVASVACEGTHPYFYRTSAGAEIDLVLERPGGELWAVEIKRSSAPRLERGFHHACEDVQPARRFVLYPGSVAYDMPGDVRVTGLREFLDLVAKP